LDPSEILVNTDFDVTIVGYFTDNVKWQKDTMATTSTPDSQERKKALLTMLKRENVIRLAEAATTLDVSTMTVRRDLEELEEEGMLRRVRGGAVSVIGARPFGERRAVRLRAKELIAEKARSFVPRFGSIALDASTTVGILGMTLGPRSGLIVATNSYPSFAAIKGTPGVNAILIGGEPDEATDSLVGPIANRAAESLRYTRFFCSASAMDSTFGTTEVSLREAETKRAFFGVSKELILCIDSSKLAQESIAAGFALSEAMVLITELDPADTRLDEFRGLIELR
jgi:DeoR family fructose operon transcriptional repressor